MNHWILFSYWRDHILSGIGSASRHGEAMRVSSILGVLVLILSGLSWRTARRDAATESQISVGTSEKPPRAYTCMGESSSCLRRAPGLLLNSISVITPQLTPAPMTLECEESVSVSASQDIPSDHIRPQKH
jgi:hypothetical protein